MGLNKGRQIKLSLLLLLILSLVFTSSFQLAQSQEESDEQVLVTLLGGSLSQNQLNFHSGDRHITSAISGSLYIFHFGTDDKMIPDLADGQPLVSEDNSTFTVKLKNDLKFSNGKPLTADDVVFSYQTYLTRGINFIPYAFFSFYPVTINYFDNNNSISRIDDQTIQFNFKQSSIRIYEILTFPIIERARLGEKYNNCVIGILDDCNWYDESSPWDDFDAFYMQSAGPYMFDRASNVSESVELVKNPYYHNQTVWADRLIFQYKAGYPGLSTEEIIATGEVDIFVRASISGGLRILDEDITDEYKLIPQPSSDMQYMEFNMIHPYLGTGEKIPDGGISNNDLIQAIQVRTAISHIIDREFIIDEFAPSSIPGTVPVYPFARGFNNSIEPHQYSITTARSYMESAGFNFDDITDSNNDGDYADFGDTSFFNVTLLSPLGNPARELWANYTESQLPKIGIGVELHDRLRFDGVTNRTTSGGGDDPIEYDLVPVHADGGFDIVFLGSFSDELEFSTQYIFSSKGLCSSSDSTYRCRNFGNYQNVKADSLSEQYEEEILDYERRESLLLQIQDILFDELPVLALHYPISTIPTKKDVSGIDVEMWRLAYTAWQYVKKNDWILPPISNDNDDTVKPSIPLIVEVIAVMIASAIILKRNKSI